MLNADDPLLESVISRLKSTIHGRESFETSQIKLIGLTDIKQRAGAEWPAFSQRIRTISKNFIERRLDKKDIVIPAGDGFIIIYMNPEDSKIKAEGLQQALNTFYLGDEDLNTLSARVHSQTIETKHLVRMLSPEPTAAPAESNPSDMAMLPVWSSAQGALTGYWITPVRRNGDGSYYGYSKHWQTSGVHREGSFLDTDLAILRRAVASIEQGIQSKRPCLVGMSAHATSLQHRDRRQVLLRELFAVPDRVRPYLIGRIAEVEPGTPKTVLVEWVHQIRSTTQRVSIEMHSGDRALTALGDMGLHSVACVLPPTPWWGPKVERYGRLIQTLGPALKRQGVKFRLDNVNSPELLGLVASGGVDFCTSDRVWPSVDSPQGIRPYTTAQLQEYL